MSLSLLVSTLIKVYRNRLVRLALTALLAGIVVVKADPQRIGHAVASVRPSYLFLALVLTLPFLALKSARWYLMLREASVEVSTGEAVRSLLGGMGLALVTPARVGEVVRAAYIRDPQKVKIAGLVLLDKGFDVLVLCGLSVVGAWVLLGPFAGVALTCVTSAGLIVVYAPGRVHRGLRNVSQRLPGETFLNRLWSSLESLSPPATTAYLVLTALSFGVVLLQFGIILLSWKAWSLDIVFLTFPLVVLTNVLPVTIGGLGVREGAAALLLSHYNVSPAHAALAAFLMFAVNTALPGLVGVLVLPVVGGRAVRPRTAAGP
jgi:glycosyltransferase 2 family protein